MNPRIVLLLFWSRRPSPLVAHPQSRQIADEGIGYRITKAQANEIVDSSILANFSPDYVNAGPAESLTSSGYIRFAMDTQTINTTRSRHAESCRTAKWRRAMGFKSATSERCPFRRVKSSGRLLFLEGRAPGCGELLRVSP